MAYTTINKSSLHMNTKLYTGGEKYEEDKEIALTLTAGGQRIEYVYKETLGQCLKSKRIADREVNGERVDAETIDNLIETMTLAEIQEAKITIDNDYEGRAGKLQDRIVELSVEQSLLEANPNLNEATLNELRSLQIELDKLDGNKTEIA